MQSIIKKIFYKELGFRENVPDDEFKKRNAEYSKCYEALDETLNEQQREMLSDLYDSSGGVQSILGFIYFKDGFQAGLLLGMELLSSKDEK